MIQTHSSAAIAAKTGCYALSSIPGKMRTWSSDLVAARRSSDMCRKPKPCTRCAKFSHRVIPDAKFRSLPQDVSFQRRCQQHCSSALATTHHEARPVSTTCQRSAPTSVQVTMVSWAEGRQMEATPREAKYFSKASMSTRAWPCRRASRRVATRGTSAIWGPKTRNTAAHTALPCTEQQQSDPQLLTCSK